MEADEPLELLKLKFFDTMYKLAQAKPLIVEPCEGITQTEANVLHAIGIIEEQSEASGVSAASPGFVASHMHVTPSALSQVLGALEKKHLLLRSQSDQDSRAVVIALTSEGRQLYDKINETWEPRITALIHLVGIDNLLSMINTVNLILDYDQKLSDNEIDVACSVNQSTEIQADPKIDAQSKTGSGRTCD